MKKIFTLVLAAVISALCLCSCTEKAEEPEAVPNTHYEIFAELDGNRLICTQRSEVRNLYADGLDELTFLLAPNAYTPGTENKAYSSKPKSYGSLEITRASVDGVPAEPRLDEDNVYMSLAVTPTEYNGVWVTEFDYEVVLPEGNYRFGISDGYINLSGFYPQLATFVDGAFRKSRLYRVGDPIVSDVADFSVTLTVPEAYVVACAGVVSESVADGKRTVNAEGRSLRDFAAAMHTDYKEKTTVSGDLTVRYYSVGDNDYGELAADVIQVFSEKFGSYPYSEFVLAETDFDADGMEFSGLVYIAADCSDFENTVVHETAHQWFYNLVGSDNVFSPYLDEGLTTFVTSYYSLLKGREDKFNEEIKSVKDAYLSYERLQKMRGEKAKLAMNGSIYEYGEYNYTMLVYNKSCLMFNSLFETVGADKFERALKVYVERNRFARADSDRLAEAFGSVTGCEMKGFIDGWCDGVTTATFSRRS